MAGKGHLQLEAYLRRDRLSLQQWLLPAIGPTDWLEVSVGGFHGVSQIGAHEGTPTYAIGGPLAQGKFLLHESQANKPPGFAIVIGGLAPTGRGGFEAPGWSGFSYLAATQSFIKEDDFLIHANIGISAISAPGIAPALHLGNRNAGGDGLRLSFDRRGLLGRPVHPGIRRRYQAGFRMIFNDHLQMDGTWGGGLWGDTPMPVWFSSGIRIVSRKHFW